MARLISLIVSDVASRYPNASPEEIADVLINSIQNEILPEAIRGMVLPPPPSKISIALEKKREARRRVKHRYANLEKRMSYVQDMEYMKYHLAPGEVGLTSLSSGLAFGDFDIAVMHETSLRSSSITRTFIEKKDGLPLPEDEGFSRFNEKLEKEKSSLYMKGEQVSSKITEFRIDDKIQERILADSLFLEAISAVEVYLRDLAKSFPDANFSLLLKADREIAEWEKVIVKLAVPSLTINEKMKLWDDVDKKLRMILRDIVPLDDEKQQSEIETLSRKIFTRMEL